MGIFLSRILKGLQYSLYLIFHPFKGFWDLKHEKKGNVYSAWVIVCLLSVLLILRRQFTGFILNFNKQNEMNVFVEILSVLAPLGLWCLSNWCITTLVDGEGSLKDIFITTAYALTPVVLINIPMLLLSNVMILEETVFYTVLDALSVFLFSVSAAALPHPAELIKTIRLRTIKSTARKQRSSLFGINCHSFPMVSSDYALCLAAVWLRKGIKPLSLFRITFAW